MLDTKDFSARVPPSDTFQIHFPSFKVGDQLETSENLDFSYDNSFQLKLSLADQGHFERWNNLPDVTAKTNVSVKSVELFTVQNLSDQTAKMRLSFVTKREPMDITLLETAPSHFEAVVINGPNFFFGEYEGRFKVNDLILVLRDFPDTYEFRNELKKLRDKSCQTSSTGFWTVHPSDGSSIDFDEAFSALAKAHRFLAFVRGANCGFGHVLGKTRDGKVSHTSVGFNKADPFYSERNWFGLSLTKSLPEVFELYVQANEKADISSHLNRAINYYCSSNVARTNSTEMAIIASHAALETLVDGILGAQGGWSPKLLNSRAPFADKLRAAFALAKIDDELLKDLPLLAERSKGLSNMDGFQLVSWFRNRAVHPKQGVGVKPFEPHQSWLLSQWMCEMLIFHLLEYRGHYYDRRVHTGRAPQAQPVPFI